MKIIRAFATLMLLLCAARAQQQSPHLAYVYPAGGRVGTTFQIVVGGQSLLSVSNAFVNGDGITAAVLERNRPMPQKEFKDLRDRLDALQQKSQAARRRNSGTNVWTTSDARELADIREKILKNPPNRKINPAMLDTVIIQISIATNAAPGEREIRLATPYVLSNPIKFIIDDLPEVTKLASKPANPDFERFLERLGNKPVPPGTPKYENRVPLPATVNGQIMPGGVDRYRFAAVRGQQIIIATSARALIPYLADAVPGWFEPTLTIYDAKGVELAGAERFHFKPDPVMHFEAPHDGEYIVEIHDSIFRGREDFVYRLTIGELPYVTSVFPLGGKAGEKTAVTLTGWNLKQTALERENDDLPGTTTSLTGDFFNAVPFVVDDLPECFAQESTNSMAAAQPVTLPIIVNGHIRQPGDSGVFKFEGRSGQQIVAEVTARRLDSPLDSFLRLTDATGKQLAFNDDSEDKASGLETHHADSYLRASLPADGTYFIHLGDIQGKGGPEFAYRLRISEPRPDFALRIVPSSLSARAGMSVPVTIYALRTDGFTNAIDLRLKNASAAFSLSGARVPENGDKVQFTLKASPQSAGKMLKLELEGSAVVNGQAITRPAIPAEDMMQAFAYRHLVPSRELAVAVSGNLRPFASDAIRILSATPVRIPAGGKATVKIGAASLLADRFNLELRTPPEGISISNILQVQNGIEVVISSDHEKTKAGANGNLIIDLVPKTPAASPNQKNRAQPSQRIATSSLPAIPFQVVDY
jgi:hypothetical protein